MQVRYYYDQERDDLIRTADLPTKDYVEKTWQEASALAVNREGWVVVKIHELDRGFLAGDGWHTFPFQPTEAQYRRCRTNHGGRNLGEIKEGLQWSELWAILTDNMWRRIVPMRGFTMCRDWPRSQVI